MSNCSKNNYDPTKPTKYYVEREEQARKRYLSLVERLSIKLQDNLSHERGTLNISAVELRLFVQLIGDAENELKNAEALVNIASVAESNLPIAKPAFTGRVPYECNPELYGTADKK